MIVKEADAIKRLESPMNLMNKLKNLSSDNANKRKNAMSLFISPSAPQIKPSFNPFENKEVLRAGSTELSEIAGDQHSAKNTEDTTLENILTDHEAQINLGLAHDSALKLLNNSVSMLMTKLEDVRADKLPQVIAAASKTVESIRKERNEAFRTNKEREVHYHFYTPEQKKVSEYEIIDVTGA